MVEELSMLSIAKTNRGSKRHSQIATSMGESIESATHEISYSIPPLDDKVTIEEYPCLEHDEGVL